MRHLAIGLSVILWSVPAQAATIFDGSFVGCTDAGACNTGTGWDTETDTGSDVVCDDGDLTTLHIDAKICADVMNDTTIGFVEEDTSFSTENEVYYRFYVKLTDGGTYPASNNFVVAQWRNEADDDLEGEVRLSATAGGYFGINQMVELDDGSQLFGDGVTGLDPNQWNCIQGWWKASSGVGANDGFHYIWLNGRINESLTGIDNDTGNIGEVRLGDIAGLDATPSMTLFIAEAIFDDAELPACNGVPPKPQPTVGTVEVTY